MTKVLVTGANGFIGWNLVARLVRRGDDVTCLVRSTSRCETLATFDVRKVHGDVTDPESLANAVRHVDVVYNLAGRTRAMHPRHLYLVNEIGAANVADACAARTSPPVLVHVSSLAAAGPSRADRPLIEADPPQPVSQYGKSKLASERQLRQRAARLPISVVRPPIVFGPGDHDCLPMFKSVRLRLHFVPGYKPERFSLIDVGDLAELLTRTAEQGVRLDGLEDSSCQGVYYATSPETPTYVELGRLIAQAMSRHRVLVVRTPHALGWLLAGVNIVRARIIRRQLLINIDKMREATAGSWTCCGDRAAEQLQFRPAESLPHRLSQCAQWYRQHGWL